MIDFTEKFSTLATEATGILKKLSVKAQVKVYYGINSNGGYRICFLSLGESPKIDSTKLIKVTQVVENKDTHWLNFDLIDLQAKSAFYALCGSLIEAIEDENIKTEEGALLALKNRFHIWKKLLKKDASAMSEEISKGLFGELYFLLQNLAPRIGINSAIEAWSGPDGLSKDFAVNDTWYEIKTVNASSTVAKIASMQQLSSTVDGHLVIIKVDTLGDKFEAENASIKTLVNKILAQITSDEASEDFLEKLIKYGYSVGAVENKKYQVVSLHTYTVDETFPRLTDADIKYTEIGKVSYELIINTLDKYKET